TEGITDVAFLTGDQHSFMAAPVSTDYDDPTAPLVAYEYTGGSITSPSGPLENLLAGGLGSYRTDPEFDYLEVRRNGYGLLEPAPEGMTLTFHELRPTSRQALPTPRVRFTATPGVVQPTVTRL